MSDIPKAAIRSIAKSAGAERISAEAIDYLQNAATTWIQTQVRQANVLANHAGRKTVQADDLKVSSIVVSQ